MRWAQRLKAPANMPEVTSANPAANCQVNISPKNSTALIADRDGTTEVIIVVRTGPKCLTMVLKVMPATTSVPPP